ncbi:hypothetical protein LXL04_026176 [Taraxacum kok-saghyz]
MQTRKKSNLSKGYRKSSPEESSVRERERSGLGGTQRQRDRSCNETETWSWSSRSSEWRSRRSGGCRSGGRRSAGVEVVAGIINQREFLKNLTDPKFERGLGYLNVGPGRN